MRQYKMGIVGYAHVHVHANAMDFYRLGERVKFIAGADVPPLREPMDDGPGTRYGLMRKTNGEIGLTNIYKDYKKMLDENNFDIMVVCCENAFHPEVCEEILRRGIHVVLEKPLAMDMRGAARIARAAREGNAEVIVNWPSTWMPHIRKAHELCAAGAVGKIFKLTYRNSESLGALSYGQKLTDAQKGAEWWHQAAAGGGAFWDYCCYGANIARWFIGEKAVAAYGLKANFNSQYGDAEDYGTITVRFPQAVALLEGSWTTVNTGIPNGPIVYGLEGTLVADFKEVRLFTSRHKPEPDAVYLPDALPEGRATLGEEVIHHFDTGEALHPTLQFPLNMDAMEILDAGSRSATSGKLELARDAFWTVQ